MAKAQKVGPYLETQISYLKQGKNGMLKKRGVLGNKEDELTDYVLATLGSHDDDG